MFKNLSYVINLEINKNRVAALFLYDIDSFSKVLKLIFNQWTGVSLPVYASNIKVF